MGHWLILLFTVLTGSRHAYNNDSMLAERPDSVTVIQPQVEVVQLTSGEMQHWMGYYDKWQVDPSGRYAIANQVPVLFRSPGASDSLIVGFIDLENENQWIPIGKSHAWGWQQANMAQWIPGKQEVIWNDREGSHYVSRVYDLETGETRTLPRPIYTLSPDGRYALTTDFMRLQIMRPGYGYADLSDDTELLPAPTDQGMYKMDLTSGENRLMISYAEISKVPRRMAGPPIDSSFHWFNHLLISPGGKRVLFLNRYRSYAPHGHVVTEKNWFRENVTRQRTTRVFTADTDFSELYLLNDAGYFSHFIWKGDHTITAWAKAEQDPTARFYDFEDESLHYEVVDHEAMPDNGHNTYVPNTNYEWILNDTYPDQDRRQTLYLYHLPTRTKVILGRFYQPEAFYGEWRCDLHPRTDQQGRRVFFDSTHRGNKRQVYMIDISEILEEYGSKSSALPGQ